MTAQKDEGSRYARPLTAEEWAAYFTTDGLALYDHYQTAPVETEKRSSPPPPAPYFPVPVDDLPTAKPATPFQPSPNAPIVRPSPHQSLAPVEDLAVGRAFRRFSWPPMTPPPAEITDLVPTVRELSPVLENNAPVAPIPDEWDETPMQRIRHTVGGMFRRSTPTPANQRPLEPQSAYDPLIDPRYSPRQRAINNAWFGGVTEEEAADLRDEMAAIQQRHEEAVLRRYFHGPHQPDKLHCRFCGEESGADRCRRAGLPHDALLWLCFECQKHIILSHETDARRKGVPVAALIEVDLLARLTVKTDYPVLTYDQFQHVQHLQAHSGYARPAPPTRPRRTW